MAKVCIIVPIYNLEKYISKCIDSILSQTLEDIEVILVDDGSTDLCGSICDSYAKKDGRVRVIHQKNMGLSGARNTGIDNCTSKWFTIIDADDWYEKDAIEKLYLNAEKYESDIFIASFFSNTETTEWVDSFFNVEEFHYTNEREKNLLQISCINNSDISNLECSTNAGVTWARIYKTEFIKRNELSFLVGLRRTQDAIFNMYAFQLANRIDYLNIPVQHYRLWDGSASKKYNADFHLTALQISSELSKFLNTSNDDGLLRSALYAKHICLIIETILLELTHEKNDNTYLCKRKVLKDLCTNDIFAESIQKVDMNTLTRGQGIAAILMKLRTYDVMLILYFIKSKLK